jgi:hypothetical protein
MVATLITLDKVVATLITGREQSTCGWCHSADCKKSEKGLYHKAIVPEHTITFLSSLQGHCNLLYTTLNFAHHFARSVTSQTTFTSASALGVLRASPPRGLGTVDTFRVLYYRANEIEAVT